MTVQSMTLQSRTATVPELSQRILDMAQTGVYRESIFEALQPLATKKSIRLAIARSKKFGLHSVASLRDETLGTYYQVDITKYSSLRHAVDAPIPHDDDALMERAIAATATLEQMLLIAKSIAFALFAGGLGCWVIGQRDACAGLMIGAASAAGIWALQKRFADRLWGDH
ncbi:MAG: hypothetical protein VKL39_18730 [Leptolyngbyaceae bacterium]|nr:hypothetical protein [Leptolyngbyaceae bacterium]